MIFYAMISIGKEKEKIKALRVYPKQIVSVKAVRESSSKMLSGQIVK